MRSLLVEALSQQDPFDASDIVDSWLTWQSIVCPPPSPAPSAASTAPSAAESLDTPDRSQPWCLPSLPGPVLLRRPSVEPPSQCHPDHDHDGFRWGLQPLHHRFAGILFESVSSASHALERAHAVPLRAVSPHALAPVPQPGAGDRGGAPSAVSLPRSYTQVLNQHPQSRTQKTNHKKRSHTAESAASTVTHVRAKRKKQQRNNPSHFIGYPPDLPSDENPFSDEEDQAYFIRPAPSIPPHVVNVLTQLSPMNVLVGSVPWTAATATLLATFPEVFPAWSQLTPAPSEESTALALVKFAIWVHQECAALSRDGSTEPDWYPKVQILLETRPPLPGRTICRPPLPATILGRNPPANPFDTVDMTTKQTSAKILPTVDNVKIDRALVFNPAHPAHHILRTTTLRLNPFNEVGSEQMLLLAGVEVKPTGGSTGEMGAEYQVGTWGLKTLDNAAQLGGDGTAACDVATSITVCGHVWSLLLTYWLQPGKAAVTHGPVVIGSTGTVAGTFQIIAWVAAFKAWSVKVAWPAWEERIASAIMQEEENVEVESAEYSPAVESS